SNHHTTETTPPSHPPIVAATTHLHPRRRPAATTSSQPPLPHMNLPPPPAPQRQRRLFQPLPPPWRAVDGRMATTAAVEPMKLPISWAVRRQTTIVVAVGRWYSHHGSTLWCRAVMAQPLVKHRGGQPPKTTTVVAAEPTTAAPWWCRACGDFVTHLQTTEFETFDVLGFWKAKETTFPVLSRMAMDILSVQATSVASESAFSTNHLDAQEHKQDKSTLETPVDFEEQMLDADVQANEVIPLSDEEIALDATSNEGSMS
nr:zinc finger BED domain-containing protein RICESLEEPER 2-like [Tanacetum cinerariifolium]